MLCVETHVQSTTPRGSPVASFPVLTAKEDQNFLTSKGRSRISISEHASYRANRFVKKKYRRVFQLGSLTMTLPSLLGSPCSVASHYVKNKRIIYDDA